MSDALAIGGGRNTQHPVTIAFFGLGAVGSSLLICLAELAERDGIPVRFRVYTIDPAGARDALYHADAFMDRIELIGVPRFEPVFALESPFDTQLAGATLLVNAAIPSFNCAIIELGLRVGGAHAGPGLGHVRRGNHPDAHVRPVRAR